MSFEDRLRNAIMQNPNILCYPENLGNHPGHTLKEFEKLGLTKSDLRKLEKFGCAIRGKRPLKTGHINAWVIIPKETTGEKEESGV